MSQPNFESANPGGIHVPKPKTSVYTVMLIVSLIALIIACAFMYAEISAYGGFGEVSSAGSYVSDVANYAHDVLDITAA